MMAFRSPAVDDPLPKNAKARPAALLWGFLVSRGAVFQGIAYSPRRGLETANQQAAT
jgi:hypothetical protein